MGPLGPRGPAAFIFADKKAIKAKKDDDSDDLTISVMYIPFNPASPTTSPGDCTTASSSLYVPVTSDMSGKIAWCIKVEGLEIKKYGHANVEVADEFRWKNTANWGNASVDPTLQFRSGFNFRSTTQVALDAFPAELETHLDQKLNKLRAAVRAEYKASSWPSGTTRTPAAMPSVWSSRRR